MQCMNLHIDRHESHMSINDILCFLCNRYGLPRMSVESSSSLTMRNINILTQNLDCEIRYFRRTMQVPSLYLGRDTSQQAVENSIVIPVAARTVGSNHVHSLETWKSIPTDRMHFPSRSRFERVRDIQSLYDVQRVYAEYLYRNGDRAECAVTLVHLPVATSTPSLTPKGTQGLRQKAVSVPSVTAEDHVRVRCSNWSRRSRETIESSSRFRFEHTRMLNRLAPVAGPKLYDKWRNIEAELIQKKKLRVSENRESKLEESKKPEKRSSIILHENALYNRVSAPFSEGIHIHKKSLETNTLTEPDHIEKTLISPAASLVANHHSDLQVSERNTKKSFSNKLRSKLRAIAHFFRNVE